MPQITLAEAIAEISTRLGDPNNVFFTHDELYLFLCESLRVFQSMTGFWKTEYAFSVTPGSGYGEGGYGEGGYGGGGAGGSPYWFAANGAGSPRLQTLTDTDVYNLIEYHLMEPPTGATWTGTNQFSITDLWQACSRRRNEMLQLAACNMVEVSPSCVPNTSVVPLPDSILDVRRVRWAPAANQGSPVTLQRGDVLSFQRFTPNYLQTSANPLRWDILTGLEAAQTTPPADTLLALVLDTLVNVPSTVQVLAIEGAADFNPPGNNPLLIPDDWAWVLKFGAMADILSKEEEGRDVQRAAYCRKRYDEGLKLMVTMPWLTQALLNGVAVDTPAVASADRFNNEWQSRASAFPGLVIGGIDLFSVSPFPAASTTGYGEGGYGGGGYGGETVSPISVELLVVQNAPIPINTGTAPIFLPRDAMEAVLKEAQHLALFKMGGAEFAESIQLHNEFLAFCMMTNKRLAVAGIYPSDYTPVVPKEYEQSPRFAMTR